MKMRRTTTTPARGDGKSVVPARKLQLPSIADQLALASSGTIFTDPLDGGSSKQPWQATSPITAEDLDLKHLLSKKKKEKVSPQLQLLKKKMQPMQRTTSMTAMMRRVTSYNGSMERGEMADDILSILRATRRNSFRKSLPVPKGSNHIPTKENRIELIKSTCRMRRPASSPGPISNSQRAANDDYKATNEELSFIKNNTFDSKTAPNIQDHRRRAGPTSVALHRHHQNHLATVLAGKQESSSKRKSILENNSHQRMEEKDLFETFWESLVGLIFPPWEVEVRNNAIPTTAKFNGDQGGSSVRDDNETNDGASWSDDDREATTLGDYSGDSDTVNYELDRLSFDLDSTQRSLVDLESEFEEDLEAFSMGIEVAFNQSWFDEDDDDEVDLEGMLRRQESQLSQSTRSNFRSSEHLNESVRSVKRKKIRNSRHTVVLEMELLKAEEEEKLQEEECLQEDEKQVEKLIEDFWLAIEWYFQQYVNYYFIQQQENQQKEDPGSVMKSFLQIWLEL